MRNKANINLSTLIVVIAFGGMTTMILEKMKSPDSVVVDKLLVDQSNYSRELDRLKNKYSNTLKPYLVPPCAPNYDAVCILTKALDHLEVSPVPLQDSFDSFEHLASTISYSDSEVLKRRILNNLIVFPQLPPDQDMNRKIAIMKLYFGLGEFEHGMKVLEEFQNYAAPIPFENGPHLAAVKYFISKNDLQNANKVVLVLQNHTVTLAEPKKGCFGSASKSYLVEKLIELNLEKGRVEEAAELLPAAIETTSMFNDVHSFSSSVNVIGQSYLRDSGRQPLPKKWCRYLLDYAAKNGEFPIPYKHYSSLIYSFNHMKCAGEQEAIVKVLRDNRASIPWQRFAGEKYSRLQIFLGEGDVVLKDISNINSRKERFRAYLEVAPVFYANNFGSFSQEALELAISMFGEARADANDEISHSYGDILSALKKMNRDDEIISLLDEVISEKKMQGAVVSDDQLVAYLRSYKHPYYDQIRNDVVLSASDKNKERIIEVRALIEKGEMLRAEQIFNEIDDGRDGYNAWSVMPSFYKTREKGDFFMRLWGMGMNSCLYSRMYHHKTEEISLVVPVCMGYAVAKGFDLRNIY